jgi:hypothetical protein
MILTLVVAAGAGLAFAYLRFEEETERIEEAIEYRAGHGGGTHWRPPAAPGTLTPSGSVGWSAPASLQWRS